MPKREQQPVPAPRRRNQTAKSRDVRPVYPDNAGIDQATGLTSYPGSGFDYTLQRTRAMDAPQTATSGGPLSVSGVAPDSPASPEEFLLTYGRSGLRQFGGFVYEEYLPELTGKRGIDTFRKMSESDAVIWSTLFALEMLMRRVSWNIEVSNQAKKAREKRVKQREQDTKKAIQQHQKKTADAVVQGLQPPDPPEFDDTDINDDSAEEAREFVEECLHDMEETWQDTLSEILTFLTYGWSWLEVCFKERRGDNPNDPAMDSQYTDGKIGWRKFAPRAQDTLYRWSYDEDGNLVGMWQIPPPDFQTRWVPRNKSLHFRTLQHKGNPEGRSVLRGAYRAWYFKQHLETIEAIGVERNLAGMPVVHAPPEYFSPNATTEQKAMMSQLKDLAIKTKVDEQMGVVFPMAYNKDGKELFKFELLRGSGSRPVDTDKIVQRYDNRISMTLLADFIMLGHENTGSFALASSKMDLFKVAMGAWLDVICKEINRHAIVPLCDLNNIKPEDRPQLIHGDVSNADLAELGAYIQQLAAAGMQLFPNDPLTNFLLEAAGLPKPAPEDQLKTAKAQSQAEEGISALKQQANAMTSTGQPTQGAGVRVPTDPKEQAGQMTVDRNGQQTVRPPRTKNATPPEEKSIDAQRPRPARAPAGMDRQVKGSEVELAIRRHLGLID